MASELQYYGNPENDSGYAVTAKVYDNAGVQVGADVVCPEVGVLAIYIGDMPTAAAGIYTVRFFDGTDFLNQGVIEWDGTAEITNSVIGTVVELARDHARAANIQTKQ